ncbi:hypothetical protein [Phormidesmis priestleyi]|nr:hypothetical protein [Phormidesmis priestleyi]
MMRHCKIVRETFRWNVSTALDKFISIALVMGLMDLIFARSF